MTLTEAKVLIEAWRKDYNETRPHSALGYRPPVTEAKTIKILTQKVDQIIGAGQANFERGVSKVK